MTQEILIWVLFNVCLVALLLVDLVVFHRSPHEVRIREAIGWSLAWVILALVFNAGVYIVLGAESGTMFLTGYLVEKSLSVDNLFVFLLIFSFFKVPAIYQHKILFYGILGALVMRGVFIFVGIQLLERFDWLFYVLGGFLVLSGMKIFFSGKHESEGNEEDKKGGKIVKLFKGLIGTEEGNDTGKFFERRGAAWRPTRLFFVLVAIEFTDLIFALDSIPAILAISSDPFIIYSSNAFAILGLRSLYFALAGLMQLFRYLDYGISFILIVIGFKMIVRDYFHLPPWAMLLIIATSLATAIAFSIAHNRRDAQAGKSLNPLV